MGNDTIGVVGGIVGIVVLILLAFCKFLKHCDPPGDTRGVSSDQDVVSDRQIRRMAKETFFSDIFIHEKPFRFKRAQITRFTRRQSTRLGTSRYSAVFKGTLPNSLAVAVKVFKRSLKIDEEHFMEVVGTMWKSRHVNLVRLVGFCFDGVTRALVYEYVDHGALDAYLLDGDGRVVGVPALLDIAVGVARGIRHLHEERKEKRKIVHYNIKLSNVLLDASLTPKIADTGLAPLLNPAATQVILSGLPMATRGCVAPEIRVQPDITEKCDVYSFGMILLEIISRKRISDEAAAMSEGGEQWFPELAWAKYESGDLMDLVNLPTHDDHTVLVIDDDLRQWEELVERMCKVAFWCVQQRPDKRPSMGTVVKMLKGDRNIAPPANPFKDVPVVTYLRTKMTSRMNTTTANGASNGTTEMIDALANIIQTVVQLDGS